MSVIGFDIGNETCYIAVARAGGIEVLDNEYSHRVTPLYVGFNENSREAGLAAKTKIIPNLENTVFNFKTILGRIFFDEITQKELSYLPYDVCELPSGDVGVKVKYLREDAVFSIQQIMAMLLNKLKTIVETKTGIKAQDCVISVPIYYTDKQRRALLDAAEIAGLKTLQLLNEATAAAVIYGYYKQEMFQTDAKIVIFVDLGQSVLTVTACKFHQEKLSILGSVWNKTVGGRDFDSVLVKHFSEEFKSRYNIDVRSNKKALMALILECEALKKQMSATSRELEITIECLMNDIDVKGKMKRELFENLSAALLLNIEKTMRDFMSQINVDCQEIDAVQIIGGSSRLPALKNLIVKVFGKEPQATLNQDEAVAKGCSLQCALLSPTLRTKSFQIEDIQTYAITVIHVTDSFQEKIPVFSRFQKIPSVKVISFPFKGLFVLEAYYENVSGDSADIGRFHFSDIPKEAQNSTDVKVEIKVSLDTNGIFCVNSAKMIVKLTNNSENTANNFQSMTVIPYENNALPPDKKEEDTSNTENVLELEEKPKDIIKSFDLEITSFLPKLNKKEIMDYINKEKDMQENDLRAKRVADLRNEVEEYMYYAKEKLSVELRDFVSEEDKHKFIQLVNEIDEWLYESDDLFEEAEFLQRLRELKRNFEPLLNEYLQKQAIRNSLNEFQTLLESSAQSIQSVSLSKDIPCKSFDEMKDHWNRANDYVRNCLTLIDKVKCSTELKVTPEMIRQEMKSLHDTVLQVLSNTDKNSEPSKKGQDSIGGNPDDQMQTNFNSNNEREKRCEIPSI